MNASYLRGIYLRLAGALTFIVMVALAVNAYLSHRTFERALAPQIAAKMASEGASVRALVLKAVDSGIPFDGLYGVEQRFAQIKDDAAEISYAAITEASGAVRHEMTRTTAAAALHFRSAEVLALMNGTVWAGPVARVGSQYIVSMPLAADGKPLGMLHMGVDVSFVDDIVLDMLYDVLVVLVVTLFFTLELLHFITGVKLEASIGVLGETFERGAAGNFATRPHDHSDKAFGPLLRLMDAGLARVNQAYASLARDIDSGRRVPAHERHPGLAAAQRGLQALGERFRFGDGSGKDAVEDNQLAKIRAPLFVFILAEELTRSFVPGFVKDLLVPLPWLSPQIVVGLPIVLFMLIVALGQPVFGVLCERIGHRRTMLAGAAVAAAGFVATALAHNVLDLLLWRSMCAVGYAMVFVAGQAYVLDNAPPAKRARSFALFVGAIMAATVCGPSIGGILADNIGVRPTFGIAALLAVGSMLVIRLLPSSRPPAEGHQPVRLPRPREMAALLMNRRFMTVTGLAAMPAKILLTGVCFYLIPLYVLSLGSTQAMAGRILMTYAVLMVMLAPLTARLASSRERMHWLVGGGLLVSGLGGMLLLAGDGVPWVFAAVVLVGVGQSLSISAQSALVGEHCSDQIAQLGDGVVYGVYRLLERVGNALGPLIAGALVLRYGYRVSFVAIGALVVLAGAGFLLATRRHQHPAPVFAETMGR